VNYEINYYRKKSRLKGNNDASDDVDGGDDDDEDIPRFSQNNILFNFLTVLFAGRVSEYICKCWIISDIFNRPFQNANVMSWNINYGVVVYFHSCLQWNNFTLSSAQLPPEERKEDDVVPSFSEIASCNYEARSRGLKNGMFYGKAKELCPELV